MALRLTSPSFEHTQMIPVDCTCDGENRSPALVWSGAPSRTASFVVLCDDPDAPGGGWVHWVLFNLPAESQGVPPGIPASPQLEDGSAHGSNDWGLSGYGGPCPPHGIHRYFFTLLALNRRLDMRSGASGAAVLAAARKHVVASAELMGRYRRR